MRNLKMIINELSNVPDPLSEEQIDNLITAINKSNHVFISGAGRSGLMINSFANRLLQIGLEVSVVGEITTPHLRNGDILIFNSASGSSEKLISQAREAKKYDVKIMLFTTDSQSSLAKLADYCIVVQAQSKYSETKSIQPMGALFEQYSMLLFDSLVLSYMQKYNITEQIMRDNHADIE